MGLSQKGGFPSIKKRTLAILAACLLYVHEVLHGAKGASKEVLFPGLKDIPPAATADMPTLRTLSASWTKRSLEKVFFPELKNMPPAAATAAAAAAAAATADMSTLRTYYLGRRVSFLLMILLLGKSA